MPSPIGVTPALVVFLRLALLGREAHRRVAFGRDQSARGRVFGRRGQRLAGVPFAGDRFGRDGEAAAFAGVVEVDRAGVGFNEGAVGEEEGVAATGRGVDKGGAVFASPAGDQLHAAAGLSAAADSLRLPLVDVVVVVGVLGDQGVARVEEETVATVGESA